MSMGKLDDAAREYRRATELDSTMEAAFRNLGYLEWTTHRKSEARSDLQKALKLSPDDTFAAYYLARLEVDDQRPAEAIPIFRKLSTGKHPWAQIDLALAYLSSGRYDDAIEAAQKVSGDHGAAPQSIIGIAEARQHHNERSIAAFNEAAKLASGQEEHWLNLTREQMDLNRLTDAMTAVQQGLAVSPKSYALNLRRGAIYFAMGKYDEAEKAYRVLVDAGDPTPMSTIGLAQVLLHTGRAPEAATLLEESERRLGPQFLIVYFDALALDHSGKRNEALAAYRRALQLNPDSVEARLGVAKTSMLLGKPDEAIPEFQQVLKAQPGNLQARRLLSRAYAMIGNQSDASKYGTQTPESDSEPETNLVGDFILPDWQQPAAE